MRHRFHSLCPYFAMFPESFAERWIAELTSPGDVVLDPFSGRGTTPFQAILMDRQAIAGDINPVAFCLTRAKTNAPAAASLLRRITQLERCFDPSQWAEPAEALPEFFHHAYARSTLVQLLYLRDSLGWRRSDVDCMLAALVLGVLHGESSKSRFYLSNQMPRTISTKPAYSVRFWKARGLAAPVRDVFGILRSRVRFRYESERPARKATVVEGDFRQLPHLLRQHEAPIRLAVTSPPYLDITNFEEDQWLRLWFLGGPPRVTYREVSKDDRHDVPSSYWRLIADMWRVLGCLLAKDSHVVIRMGGKRLEADAVVAGLSGTSVFSRRGVRLVSAEVSPIRNRQTHSFRPGTTGCVREVDCCYHVE